MPVEPIDPATAKALMALFGLDPAQSGIIRGQVPVTEGKVADVPIRPLRTDAPAKQMTEVREGMVRTDRGMEQIKAPEVRKRVGSSGITLEKTGRRVALGGPVPDVDPHVVSTALLSRSTAERTAALEHIRRTSNLFRNNLISYFGPSLIDRFIQLEHERSGQVLQNPLDILSQHIASAFQRAQAERERVGAQTGTADPSGRGR